METTNTQENDTDKPETVNSADWNVKAEENPEIDYSVNTGNYGSGKGANPQQQQANLSGSNAILKLQQLKQQESAEAVAKLAANNNAQTAQQVANSGLAGQGMGVAMANETAQENAQMALNQMNADQQAEQQAIIDAAAEARREEEHILLMNQQEQARVDNLRKQWQDYIAAGDFDAADRLSVDNDLGWSSALARLEYLTNDDGTGKLDSYMESLLKQMEAADPITRANIQAEYNALYAIQQQAMAMKISPQQYIEFAKDALSNPNSFTNDREWSPQEEAAWTIVESWIGTIAQTNEGNIFVGQITNKILESGGHKNINDFWKNASLEEMNLYGEMLGLAAYLVSESGDITQSEYERLVEFMGAGSIAGSERYMEGYRWSPLTNDEIAAHNSAVVAEGMTKSKIYSLVQNLPESTMLLSNGSIADSRNPDAMTKQEWLAQQNTTNESKQIPVDLLDSQPQPLLKQR